MATFISLMKICYIVKNPSYTDVFYIQNYRYQGPGFIIEQETPYLQQYPLATQIPLSSISSQGLNVISFLYAFNLQSTVPGVQSNIDIYPSLTIIDQNTVELMLQTLYDNVKIAFYAFTVVIYDNTQISNSGLSFFTFGDASSNSGSINLVYNSGSTQMLQFNTFIGLKAFHVCTKQVPNFLNFQTTFPNNTEVTFPSKNDINWGYMKFEILVIEAEACPWSAPYYIKYLNDCQKTIPIGYVKDCQGNFVIDFQMNLNQIIKTPSQNQVELMFNLEPSDPSLSNLLSQIDWNNALQIDIPGTKNIQYISSPFPQLKITIDYPNDLESLQKTMTISAYDPTVFPVNFSGWKKTKVSLQMTSSNNLAINFYDDSVYTTAKGVSYICIIISCLYMASFLIGFIVGKVYILQMAFVLQVTFLSLVSLKKVTPTMFNLSYLRYVFGYWISGNDSITFSQEGRNYMKLMGISNYFLLNYNVMFIFFILTFVLAIVFHFLRRPKARKFFLLDTPVYLVLWFGMWTLCAGQIQIRALTIYHESNPFGICGILFFAACLIIFAVYFVLYCIKNSQIDSFYSVLNSSEPQIQNKSESKTRYFYVILFIQRIILSTLFANAFQFNFLNILIISIHLTIMVLIVIFKPYKFKNKEKHTQGIQGQKNCRIPPLLRANIRQILNYSILIVILTLLFITNQIQQSQFTIYIPVIVIILLFIDVILTVFFLIFDKRLKQDFEEFKKLFDQYEEPKEQKTIIQKLDTTDRKVKHDDIEIDFIEGQTPKANLMSKRSDFDRSFEFSLSPRKSLGYNQYDLRYFAGQNQRNNLSIDQQLMIVAEKKQEMYRKKKQSGTSNQQTPHYDIAKLKSYHQIMKGVTPRNGQKVFENQKSLKYFPYSYDYDYQQ